MGGPTWVMQRAGVLGDGLRPLTPLDLLTPGSRYQFIEDVINELQFGTPNLPFLCGTIPSTPLASSLQDLHDEKKYPEFHRNWVDTYEKIAQGLNHPGAVIAPPFFDISLSLPNLDISLPEFSLDWFTIDLPELMLKLGIEFPPPLPDLPAFPPNIAIDLPIPPHPLWIELPQLAFMFTAILKLPKIIIDLAIELSLKLPTLFPIDLPKLYLTICKIIKEKIFPKDPANEGILDVTNAAAASVLARKTTELALLSLLGMMVGSGPLVVGGAASEMGMTSEDPDDAVNPYKIELGSVRGRVASVALSAVNRDLHSSRDPAHKDKLSQYAEFLFPNDGKANREGWVKSSGFSACGVFVRACYRQAGGGDIPETDPGSSRAHKVNLPYSNSIGDVINDLKQLAISRGAVKYDVNVNPNKRVKLVDIDIQQGDTIFISKFEGESNNVSAANTHVLLVLGESENSQPGKRILSAVQGGTSNSGNENDKPRLTGQQFSKARVTLVEVFGKKGQITAQGEGVGNRNVIEIWDAKRTITGSD